MACTTWVCANRVLLTAVTAAVVAGCSQASRLDTKCVAGDVIACTQLGDMYANGRGVPRDIVRAGQAYERSCNLGAPDVCNTLGEIIEMTGDLDGGTRRAELFFQKACEGGSLPGCLNLGLAAAAREELTLAASLYERSCDGGWAPGCHQLGLSHQEGLGVAKDIAKAVALFSHACDGEFVDSCVLLGNLYAAGVETPKDKTQALAFFAKAHEAVPGIVPRRQRKRLPRTRQTPYAGGGGVGRPDAGRSATRGRGQRGRPIKSARLVTGQLSHRVAGY